MNARTAMFLAISAVLTPLVVLGQEPPKAAPGPETEKTIKLVLHPMAEPRPALRYQLLPPLLDRRPGNAAVWWNRISTDRTASLDALSKGLEKTDEWMKLPIGDPREKKLRSGIKPFVEASFIDDMHRAARFDSCDWQLPIHEGNFFALLLPEVQQTRTYAKILAARAHLMIAEGRYDDAIRALQTGYALARHVAQGPTLVQGLVGVAIAGEMSDQVEQLIQRPDAPNLYWALSTLPRPLIDLRPAFDFESQGFFFQMPELRDLDKKQLSPDQWRDLLVRTGTNLFQWSGNLSNEARGQSPPVEVQVDTMAMLIQGDPRANPWAKQYLIEQGRSAAEVEAMPVAQVVLLYSVSLYKEVSDSMFKWTAMPLAEIGDGLDRAEQQLKEIVSQRREILPIASFLLPAVRAIKQSEIRLPSRLALLRVFEALRLYAAAHDGQLPNRLSDMVDVPVPVNPYTGKPFGYQREGNRAIVTAEAVPARISRRYEITMAPKGK